MTSSVLVALRVKADPIRTFAAFTREIGEWWRPDGLFMITAEGDGVLAFEGEADGRLVSRLPNGRLFEVGRIVEWREGERLVFTWRPATFLPEQTTRVEVDFEPVEDETRVTVRHFGWAEIPQKHAARHGFPAPATLARASEWWRRSLGALQERLG